MNKKKVNIDSTEPINIHHVCEKKTDTIISQNSWQKDGVLYNIKILRRSLKHRCAWDWNRTSGSSRH